MKVELWKIGRPKPYPGNPRRNDSAVAAVAASIKEFGFRQPIVVDEDEVIIVGHTRLKAAEFLGLKTVPVHVAKGLTKAQKRAYRLADNKTNELSAWDESLLAVELNDLAAANFDMAPFGFGEDEAAAKGGGDGFDATPSGQPRSKLDEVYVIGGKHRLLVGDCESPKNIDRLFAGKTPAMMVTDPPYGVKYDPKWRHEAGVNKSKRVGSVANDDRAEWTAVWRLFPGNIVYVWHGALHGHTVFESLESAGFAVRAQLVWVKPRLVLSRGTYHWKHEPVLVADRDGEAGEIVDDSPTEVELAYYGVRKGGSAAWRGGRKQTTAWEIGFAGETKTHHGTQKPIECMARPIRNHGGEGDIVYDPFLGSGTTLIAAHRLNRVCFGCEIDPRYADVILKRAEAEGMTCEKETDARAKAEANATQGGSRKPRAPAP